MSKQRVQESAVGDVEYKSAADAAAGVETRKAAFEPQVTFILRAEPFIESRYNRVRIIDRAQWRRWLPELPCLWLRQLIRETERKISRKSLFQKRFGAGFGFERLFHGNSFVCGRFCAETLGVFLRVIDVNTFEPC